MIGWVYLIKMHDVRTSPLELLQLEGTAMVHHFHIYRIVVIVVQEHNAHKADALTAAGGARA